MEICPGESTWRPCKSLCLKHLGKVALYQTELRSLPDSRRNDRGRGQDYKLHFCGVSAGPGYWHETQVSKTVAENHAVEAHS